MTLSMDSCLQMLPLNNRVSDMINFKVLLSLEKNTVSHSISLCCSAEHHFSVILFETCMKYSRGKQRFGTEQHKLLKSLKTSA